MHRLKNIEKIKVENFFAFEQIALYLNEFPTLINEEIIEEMVGGVAENEELCFSTFLSLVLCDEDEESALLLEKEYLRRTIKKLDPDTYINNPYFKNIKIPNAKNDRWQLGYQTYQPYEGFIYDDILMLPNYREIPRVGFFPCEFTFPTVFEDGVEWMAIKPNEIETMKPHLEKMAGRVAVFGLGMGYFAYMASLKDEVSHITIIERDQSVIDLFVDNILPQFKNAHKISIIKADAFDFAENQMKGHSYDCAFVDLWHDVSDGVELYIKMKHLEVKNPQVSFNYWIEDSILSSVRWHVFDGISQRYKKGEFDEPFENVQKYLSNDYLRELVKFL